ncbi:HNH endonuclease [Streptomyces paludis]|uniref:HNH endonuclease n=1 Tax=Streptomyces paludis TaxID=2282738 RepID=A0A345HUS9_9ACTN|nr:HNH endonuclease [Streptomyces paludis]
MPRKPRTPCTIPGCPELTTGGRCAAHEREATAQRVTPGTSAYGRLWPRIRRAYLYANPWCVLCGRLANVADHFPLSRRELLAQGVLNPDTPKHLRPLCVACHNRETARKQPGGFAAEAKSRREAGERPPF